jgi:hypothetical protein
MLSSQRFCRIRGLRETGASSAVQLVAFQCTRPCLGAPSRRPHAPADPPGCVDPNPNPNPDPNPNPNPCAHQSRSLAVQGAASGPHTRWAPGCAASLIHTRSTAVCSTHAPQPAGVRPAAAAQRRARRDGAAATRGDTAGRWCASSGRHWRRRRCSTRDATYDDATAWDARPAAAAVRAAALHAGAGGAALPACAGLAARGGRAARARCGCGQCCGGAGCGPYSLLSLKHRIET